MRQVWWGSSDWTFYLLTTSWYKEQQSMRCYDRAFVGDKQSQYLTMELFQHLL